MIAIFSIEQPASINIPNKAVPNAVAKTIKAVVNALIEPIYFTPYISAQVEDPNKLAKPLEIPIKPKNKKADCGASKYIITNVAINKGMFMKISNFLLVNLSIKYPDTNKVRTEQIE